MLTKAPEMKFRLMTTAIKQYLPSSMGCSWLRQCHQRHHSAFLEHQPPEAGVVRAGRRRRAPSPVLTLPDAILPFLRRGKVCQDGNGFASLTSCRVWSISCTKCFTAPAWTIRTLFSWDIDRLKRGVAASFFPSQQKTTKSIRVKTLVDKDKSVIDS
jgi:hypothetical protein